MEINDIKLSIDIFSMEEINKELESVPEKRLILYKKIFEALIDKK